MAARSSVNKRQREMLRKERAADKVTRRDERKLKSGEAGPEGDLLEGVLVDGVLVDGVLVDGVFVEGGPSVVASPAEDGEPAALAVPPATAAKPPAAAGIPPAAAPLPSSAASTPSAASPTPAVAAVRAAK